MSQSSDDPQTVKTGFHILVGALAFQVSPFHSQDHRLSSVLITSQVFLFMSFVGVTIVFDRRSRRGLGAKRQPIQPLFICFYITAALVILRSIYRLIGESIFRGVHMNHDSRDDQNLRPSSSLQQEQMDIPSSMSGFSLSLMHSRLL